MILKLQWQKNYYSTQQKKIKYVCSVAFRYKPNQAFNAEKIIEPYNRIMDDARCDELLPEIQKIVEKYDTVIFFKAGARKLYEQCIVKACEMANVRVISFGFGFMGGINDLPKYLSE